MQFAWSVNGGEPIEMSRNIGNIPIMVKSERCHLNGKTPKELIALHEEQQEMGGYFIINGNEKLMRMLIMPRRNHVLALTRPSFKKRGGLYTEYGSTIRCVRRDQTAQTVTVHYLSNGTCMFRFAYKKQEYLIPVMLILKALAPLTDVDIYNRILRGDDSNR